jgi:hypothetical protein
MLAPPFDVGAVHDSETDVAEAAEPDTAVGAPGAVTVLYVKVKVFEVLSADVTASHNFTSSTVPVIFPFVVWLRAIILKYFKPL